MFGFETESHIVQTVFKFTWSWGWSWTPDPPFTSPVLGLTDVGHKTWFMWCYRWNQDPHACLSDTLKQLSHIPSSKGNPYKKWQQYIPLLSNNWKYKIWVTLNDKVRREFLCIYSLQNISINWGFHTSTVSIFCHIYLPPATIPRSLPFLPSSSSFSFSP